MRFVGLIALCLFVSGLAGCAGQADVRKPAVPEVADDVSVGHGHDAPSAIDCRRQDEFGPVHLSPDEYRARSGVGVTRASDAVSSKEQPIEVCMVEGQLEWLVALTCADGSHPFSTPQEAHASRSGNVGGGGRCGSIIDLYVVPCPEGELEIYMDLYMCPE